MRELTNTVDHYVENNTCNNLRFDLEHIFLPFFLLLICQLNRLCTQRQNHRD